MSETPPVVNPDNGKNPEGAVIYRAPFADKPCLCLKEHRPTPIRTEAHHVYPQEFQKKRYGGKVPDQTLVNLCDNAHAAVHEALTRRLRGEDFTLPNRYQQSIVEAGLAKIREA